MMCLGLMAMMKQVSSRWSVGDLLSEKKVGTWSLSGEK